MSVPERRPRTDGPGRRVRALEPPPIGSRRRKPELVVGVLLVVACALGAVLLATGGPDGTPVLALNRDVERGEAVAEGDFRVTEVAADSAAAHVGEADRQSLVGQAATEDLGAGTIVTRDQFTPWDALVNEGEGAVDVVLEAGQLPARLLASGDLVNVVVAGGAGTGTAVTGSGEQPRQHIEGVRVVAVTQLSDDQTGAESWSVSLVADAAGANDIAEAVASGGRAHLVLVGS
jgi:hypothetical protein